MKKTQFLTLKYVFALTFLLAIKIGNSQNVNHLFVEANKLFQQKEYNKAIEKYLDIKKQNVESAELYFNLANAYYRTNKVAPSIYYYEKALQLDPNNTKIKNNLNIAKQMTLDNIEALPKSLGQRILENTIQKLSYNSWAYIAIAFSFLFAILFLLYHFSSETSKKRFLFVSSITSAILLLLSVAFAFNMYDLSKKNNFAIIFVQETSVKNAPTLSAEDIFNLHEGTKVQVLKSIDNWKQIKIADGQSGWIIDKELKEL